MFKYCYKILIILLFIDAAIEAQQIGIVAINHNDKLAMLSSQLPSGALSLRDTAATACISYGLISNLDADVVTISPKIVDDLVPTIQAVYARHKIANDMNSILCRALYIVSINQASGWLAKISKHLAYVPWSDLSALN